MRGGGGEEDDLPFKFKDQITDSHTILQTMHEKDSPTRHLQNRKVPLVK